MFLYLIICYFWSPRFLHLSSNWISDGASLGYRFQVVAVGIEYFYILFYKFEDCNLLLNSTYVYVIYLFFIIYWDHTSWGWGCGQFEFLIVLLFNQLVCLFISKVTCNLCFHGKHWTIKNINNEIEEIFPIFCRIIILLLLLLLFFM